MTDATQTPEDVKPPTNEKPTTYSKKAQVVSITLIVIVLAGLFAQTYVNWKKREERAAQADADAAKREGDGSGRKVNRIEDFGDALKKATQKDNDLNAANKEQKKRDEKAEQHSAEMGETGTAEANANAVTEESIIHAQKMNDLKVALAAPGQSKMGHSSYRSTTTTENAGAAGLPRPKTQGNEISVIDAKIKEIEAKTNEIEAKKKALANGGTSALNYANATNPNPSRANALPNQVFGEIATNRVVRDPTNSGARAGESVVVTGSILSAVLDTDMISDYAGNAIAVIQRPFYDTTQENVIFPAGTKITLKSLRVTSVNEVIQNRMAILPQWIIRPDGKRIDFKRTAGMDSAGVGALQDQVDRHILAQITGVAAYAILGLGPSTANYGAEPNSSKDAFVREATAQSRNAGRQFAEKYLNIVPSITIRAGTPIKIFIEDDIFVTPWEPINAEHFRAVR